MHSYQVISSANDENQNFEKQKLDRTSSKTFNKFKSKLF